VVKAITRFGILILALTILISQIGIAWAVADRSSATLHLVAMVSPKVKLQVARETSQIAATMEDLDRGYVEVPNAVELLVWTNSRNGLTITAQVGETLQGAKGHSIPISALSVSVNGEGFRPFTPGDQIIYVGRGQEIRSSKRIDYRLNLDWRTQPDTYAVNITLTVTGN